MFDRRVATLYCTPTGLNRYLCWFFMLTNAHFDVISLNTHSTVTRHALICLLNSSIPAVRGPNVSAEYGQFWWVLIPYAGSPYNRYGSPDGLVMCWANVNNTPDSFNKCTLCLA